MDCVHVKHGKYIRLDLNKPYNIRKHISTERSKKVKYSTIKSDGGIQYATIMKCYHDREKISQCMNILDISTEYRTSHSVYKAIGNEPRRHQSFLPLA